MKERQLLNRPEIRPLVIRKLNRVDIFIDGAIIFLRKLGIQLSKTLLATILATAAEYLRKKADPETASLLNKHGVSEANRPTEAQRNLYGNVSPSNYSGQYNSGYNPRKTYGEETFPGF